MLAAIDGIDALLPQTQCRQCGYDGCRPYAAAIHAGTAGIDRCPPGGVAGVAKLAAATGRRIVPLDAGRGVPKPLALAVIDEAICIGCTLCIQACPVDAIVGGAKRMHDVVADLCTGCELCVAPCPVDCIRMEPAGFEWSDEHAAAARRRHDARVRRLARLARDDEARRGIAAVPAGDAAVLVADDAAASRRRTIVAAAVARARVRAEAATAARLSSPSPPSSGGDMAR